MSLFRYLTRSSQTFPSRTAVEHGADGTFIDYRTLDARSNELRDRLAAIGVSPGDRVGVYLHKSIDAITAIFGILKAGAAYVPVDPNAPASRNAFILSDCTVAAAIIDERFADPLLSAFSESGFKTHLIRLQAESGGLAGYLAKQAEHAAAPPTESYPSSPNDLAYILYTSGSTGKPKGVMISHQNAESFVDWCFQTFEPTESDRFSSHAPLHFDLSILDIYTALGSGGTLVLIPGDLGKEPLGLAQLMAQKKISIWYSAPSILSLMTQYGKMEEQDYSALRYILFAGEVFPIVHLRHLKEIIPHPRYFNLYGPTETNVCTYYEIPDPIPNDRQVPFPIGKTCPHLVGRVVDADGRDVTQGVEGELCMAGESVLLGYWNLPEQSQAAFLDSDDGQRWYRTGDLVVEESEGNYTFVGRRDRMIKKRGYRVELGEIESCLYRHDEVQEAAVIATSNEQAEVTIVAHIASRDGRRLSLIALKRFCAEHLPLYMVPDSFNFHEALPKTSTDKIDYQTLARTE